LPLLLLLLPPPLPLLATDLFGTHMPTASANPSLTAAEADMKRKC
jgi:hypothetical protein